jgi:hypothetical protein
LKAANVTISIPNYLQTQNNISPICATRYLLC